jgi:CheY-like chemotaxis protein
MGNHVVELFLRSFAMEKKQADNASSGKNDYLKLLKSIKRNTDPEKNTVLIVDDEKGIRKKIARDVKAFDRSVVVFEAANGVEALEMLNFIRANFVRDPLLIVLDLNMPVLNGWDLIEMLKKEYESKGKKAGIPIVVLSSTSGKTIGMPIVVLSGDGRKIGMWGKKNVLEGKSGYAPLVTIAKEKCVEKSYYDAVGKKGLLAWLEFFITEA